MQPLVLTSDLLRRAERFDSAFHLARMRAAQEAWEGFGIEVRSFGPVTAIRVEAGLLRSKNRIGGFSAAEVERLPELLEFYREKGLPCSLSLPFDGWSPALFDALTWAGMRSSGSGATPSAIPSPWPQTAGVHVRVSPPDERAEYLDIYRLAFGTRGPVGEDELRFQWAEDSLPGARRFVGEIDGKVAAMASLIMIEGVAYMGTCGVFPEFRGRGLHLAMIKARLDFAYAAGADIALGGGSLFSPPRRNFERCGFAALPLGMSWHLPS